jgi:hypothetical protein
MDAMVTNTTSSPGAYPVWDFVVASGKVPIITGTVEASQQAAVTAYTQLGLIPQLGSVGVDWLGLLTGNTTLNNVDISINDGLIANGKGAFSPSYSFKNGGISVNIKKAQVAQNF